MLEEPFFFDNNNYYLFGILHHPLPGSKRKDLGVVLCAPFAEEKLWSHRVYVSFARELAKEGYSVLRFDYMGHGDSSGNFEDSTIQTRLSDITRSIEIIKKKGEVRRVGLLGLRLGATLAVMVAERISNIDFLVLWEPVVEVEAYLQQCLRSNLATQMAIYKKIVRNRKEMTEDLLEGKPVNVEGYMMSGEFYKQASKIDLINYNICFSSPVQIIQISKNEKIRLNTTFRELYEKKYGDANDNNEFCAVVEEPFWSEIKTYYQNAPNLFNKTITWLNGVIGTESDWYAFSLQD